MFINIIDDSVADGKNLNNNYAINPLHDSADGSNSKSS